MLMILLLDKTDFPALKFAAEQQRSSGTTTKDSNANHAFVSKSFTLNVFWPDDQGEPNLALKAQIMVMIHSSSTGHKS